MYIYIHMIISIIHSRLITLKCPSEKLVVARPYKRIFINTRMPLLV